MSSSHEQEPWIDRWWPLFLILFGLTFALILATFRPGEGKGANEVSAVAPGHTILLTPHVQFKQG